MNRFLVSIGTGHRGLCKTYETLDDSDCNCHDAHTVAQAALREIAEEGFAEQVEAMAAEGMHKWVWDPEVPNVLGFVHIDDLRRGLVIVYLEGEHGPDFEYDFQTP